MRGSIAALGALLTRHLRGHRAFRAHHVPLQALLASAVVVACASMIMLGRPVEAAIICAVAIGKVTVSYAFTARARSTLAALNLDIATRTPLTQAIQRLSGMLALGVLGLGAGAFAAGLLSGQTAGRTAPAVLIVGGFPLELPAVASAMVVAKAARMVRRTTMVQRLAAVETLGATTVICTTRTGWLTRNELMVTTIIAAGRSYETTGAGYSPDGDIRSGGGKVSLGENVALDECLLAGFACNDSAVIEAEDGTWQVTGDPLEAALLTSAAKLDLGKAPPRVATLPFAPDRRFMATLHRLNDDEPGVVYVKGSVERVLYLCDTQLDGDGNEQQLDGDAIGSAAQTLKRRGLRVVAFAHALVPPHVDALTEGTMPRLTFAGVQAMHDPVRVAALDAIRACHDAGILVKMITGDEAATAAMTAAWVGLDGDALMTGTELRTCPPDELPEAVARTAVFARMSPEESAILVRVLRSDRHVVAFMGDHDDALPVPRAVGAGFGAGPNDAGIDLPPNGADAAPGGPARDSADVVLHGGDIASITAMIAEGRDLLADLARYIEWAVASALVPGLVLATATLTATTLPIDSVQLLWLSIVAVLMLGPVFHAVANSASDGPRRRRPPVGVRFGPLRPARALLVTGTFMGGAFGLFRWELAHGASLAAARTAVVDLLVFALLVFVLRIAPRPRLDPFVLAGAIALTMLQLAYTYVPVLNDPFGSAPLDAASWLGLAVAGLSCFAVLKAASLLPVRPLGRFRLRTRRD